MTPAKNRSSVRYDYYRVSIPTDIVDEADQNQTEDLLLMQARERARLDGVSCQWLVLREVERDTEETTFIVRRKRNRTRHSV